VRLYRPPIVAARREDAGVRLINTDGMAFIGPGSEWFWTAISGLVLAVTFLAIYRQLSIQRDSAAIEQVAEMERVWTSERMSRSKLAVLVAIERGTAPLDIPDKAATHVGDFWERMGYLTRTGHMNRQFVYDQWTLVAQTWWARLRPSTLAWRERDEEPRTWVEFEWLAQMMAEMDRKAGISRSLDPDVLARGLPVAINQMRQAVEIDESLRTVTVRLAPIPIPVTVARPTEDAAGQGARDIHLTA
jgi:hypothetical protein